MPVIRQVSNLQSPYDVTADDWHAHWHDEDEAERQKRIKRLDWYNRPEDFATVGYRGLHQHKIEYSAADRQRLIRHRAAFASPAVHKADNQTSSRLFGDAKAQVRIPEVCKAPLTVRVQSSPVIAAPAPISPHLRGLPGYSGTCCVRSDVKGQDLVNHALGAEPRTAAAALENGEVTSPSSIWCHATGSCLTSVTPPAATAVREGHASSHDERLHHIQPTDDVCPICEGSYTHDEPGVSTPCCGLLVHQLCNFEALEEHGRCAGCHGAQAPAEIPEPGSPSMTEKYICHFVTKSHSFSTCSLKSEQGEAASCGITMTLREYVESQAEPWIATSSVATNASSASLSWLSSAEDSDSDEEDFMSSKGTTGTLMTSANSPQRSSPLTSEETEPTVSEMWIREAVRILNGATEDLVDACRRLGMCVDEEFKDKIVERILAGLDSTKGHPPLPTAQPWPVSRPKPWKPSREQMPRLLQAITFKA